MQQRPCKADRHNYETPGLLRNYQQCSKLISYINITLTSRYISNAITKHIPYIGITFFHILVHIHIYIYIYGHGVA